MDAVLQSFTACFSSVQETICSGELSWQALLSPTIITMGNRSFQVIQQIGEGGYSFVYKVREVETAEQFALKKLMLSGEEQLSLARREAATLESLKSPHLLPLLHQSVEANKDPQSNAAHNFYMLFPLYETSLFEEILKRRDARMPLSSEEILAIFLQVCEGLQCMHTASVPLAHRDIKPQNILLKKASLENRPGVPEMQRADSTETSTLLNDDFGSTVPAVLRVRSRQEAVQLQEDAEAHCSAPYRAPELFDVNSDCQIDERIDVWSLGCVLYFCLRGTSPFEKEIGSSLALAVQNGAISWPQEDSTHKAVRNLVQYCLTLDAARRPFVSQVKQQAQTVLDNLKSAKP